MVKKERKVKKSNAVARDLRTPKYRQRVERSKKAYSRKPKHSGAHYE
jgi:stalled ribosome alternative rescue factor ArfA